MSNIGQPIVSVCCITYNHEKFISDAIDGFLAQKTDFPIEILIHEDASTDGTANIIRRYQAEHPELINVIYQIDNQFSRGVNYVLKNVLGMAKGKYIALCEGDDYWIDPLKLQKQVDFLEMDLGCTICFHQTLRKYEDQEKDPYFLMNFSGAQIFKKEHLYTACIIQTCSVLFRRIPMEAYFENSAKLRIGDWPLFVYLAQFGDIGYLDEIMSVYRIHSQGLWNSFGQKGALEVEAEALEFFKNSGLFEFKEELYDSLFRRYYKLALLHHQANEDKIADEYLLKCFSLLPRASIKFIRFFISLFVQIKLPKLYEYRERMRRQQ